MLPIAFSSFFGVELMLCVQRDVDEVDGVASRSEPCVVEVGVPRKER